MEPPSGASGPSLRRKSFRVCPERPMGSRRSRIRRVPAGSREIARPRRQVGSPVPCGIAFAALPSGSNHFPRTRPPSDFPDKLSGAVLDRAADAPQYPPHSGGAVAQLGERRVRNAEVGSSILLGSTIARPDSQTFLLISLVSGAPRTTPSTCGAGSGMDAVRPVNTSSTPSLAIDVPSGLLVPRFWMPTEVPVGVRGANRKGPGGAVRSSPPKKMTLQPSGSGGSSYRVPKILGDRIAVGAR